MITKVVARLEPSLVPKRVHELKELAALEEDEGVGEAARAVLETCISDALKVRNSA
jgi:hypothetical protein